MNEDLKGYNWEELLGKAGTDETFQILHETLLVQGHAIKNKEEGKNELLSRKMQNVQK